MRDVTIPNDEVQDPFEKNEPGKGVGRDPERTPMQWDATAHAGFTTGHPWLRLGEDWASRNVATLADDPHSILTFHRRMLALRRRYPALATGAYEPSMTGDHLFAYARVGIAGRVVVMLNFGADPVDVPPTLMPRNPVALLSTHLDRDGALALPLTLRGNEGVVVAGAPELPSGLPSSAGPRDAGFPPGR